MLKLDHISPGVTLSATDALKAGQQIYTAEQVAYLIALAYETGHRQAHLEDICEAQALWDERPAGRCTVVRPRAKAVRDQRKKERLVEYEKHAGPPRFKGGLPLPPPVPGQGEHANPGPFPTLASQAAWLGDEDVRHLRDLTRHRWAPGRAA